MCRWLAHANIGVASQNFKNVWGPKFWGWRNV